MVSTNISFASFNVTPTRAIYIVEVICRCRCEVSSCKPRRRFGTLRRSLLHALLHRTSCVASIRVLASRDRITALAFVCLQHCSCLVGKCVRACARRLSGYVLFVFLTNLVPHSPGFFFSPARRVWCCVLYLLRTQLPTVSLF